MSLQENAYIGKTSFCSKSQSYIRQSIVTRQDSHLVGLDQFFKTRVIQEVYSVRTALHMNQCRHTSQINDRISITIEKKYVLGFSKLYINEKQ
jgi:hypothetical protein